MSLLDAQAAELDYDDHPDDSANWRPRRRYVTGNQDTRSGARATVSHIVARRVDYLPNGWMSACSRLIRGTVSAPPPLRICPRCERMVNG